MSRRVLSLALAVGFGALQLVHGIASVATLVAG